MKLTIKRSEWLRGEGAGLSSLLRKTDNKRCCLGFLAATVGATDAEILDMAAPVSAQNVNWPPGFLWDEGHTTECGDLMETNDSRSLTEEEREMLLTATFTKLGIEVEFID